jgi:lipid II:glycine glycyltransferase (peptidoglycan interpeptide bridge formation enzyme)
MSYRVVELTEEAGPLNDFVSRSPFGNILQSWEWGEFLKRQGLSVFRLGMMRDDTLVFIATIARYPLPFGWSYLYCPRGPVLLSEQYNSKDVWEVFFQEIHLLGKREHAVFFRLDPPFSLSSFPAQQLGFVPAPRDRQPRATLLIDLTQSEAQLLHRMKPKWRYNIHVAERRGVTVREATSEDDIAIFTELVAQTASRQHFRTYRVSYFQELISTLGPQRAAVYLASYRGQIIVGILVTYSHGVATYLHGGSSRNYRDTMASHLLQWHAMREARRRGCTVYDFWGIVPQGAGPRHPFAGITRFKLGFGGRRVEYAGTFDLPFSRFWYILYRKAALLRRAVSFS